MAVEWATPVTSGLLPQRPTRGCTDACSSEKVLVAGRGVLEWRDYHDPASHERYGARLARTIPPLTFAAAIVQAPNGLVIDLGACCATVDGRHVNPTPSEWRVLALLASRPNVYVGMAILDQELFGESGPQGRASHLLRIYVARLRSKLGAAAKQIVCRPGIGYRLALEEMNDG